MQHDQSDRDPRHCDPRHRDHRVRGQPYENLSYFDHLIKCFSQFNGSVETGSTFELSRKLHKNT